MLFKIFSNMSNYMYINSGILGVLNARFVRTKHCSSRVFIGFHRNSLEFDVVGCGIIVQWVGEF